ncbi:hypothetical protein ACLOJK_026023 [Asimina triloba]
MTSLPRPPPPRSRFSVSEQTQEIQLDRSGVKMLPTEETLTENRVMGNGDSYPGMNENSPATTIFEKKPLLLQRINGLSDKLEMVKSMQCALSEEVKRVIPASFLDNDLSTALLSLGAFLPLMRIALLPFALFFKFLLLTGLSTGFSGNKYEELKKKYLEENIERKRLYNEVIELKGNIRVFCRCRPLRPDEITNGSSSVVDIDPTRETELQIICSDSSKKQFKFDYVFSPQDNQEVVFAQTSPIVTSVLDGFNVCIFAYGQTGTGKTFTMEGSPGNRGVNYRTLEQLFQISQEKSSTMRYELFVSMLEVYNEKIGDLLLDHSNQPAKKLEIKQASEGTQEVVGLVEAPVFSIEEVWELLKFGNRNRAVGSTSANQLSSRSHCAACSNSFQVLVCLEGNKSKPTCPNDEECLGCSLLHVTVKGESLISGQRSRSHLWLVDLAGSERVGKTEVEGERLKESQFINKSLSALGDVISALASKNPHIPYRNSKLTHLLQSSLGGDCKTLMFVQISPSAMDLGETLCSLNFASRVRGIEHGPARKQSDPIEFFKYKQMAEKLKQDEKESKKMMDSLHLLQLKFAAREQLCRNLQEKVRDLESQLVEERKTRLQQENRAAARDQKAHAEKKPPLIPSNVRPPLSRITNVLPRVGPTQIRVLPQTAKEEKENMIVTPTSTVPQPNKPPMKARRVSLASSAHPAKMQPKRRISVAIIPSSTNGTAKYSSCINTVSSASRRTSFVKDPRRQSRLFTPLPESMVAAMTPDNKISRSISSSASKFFSPTTAQRGSWIPNLPTVASPRRSRLAISSPLNLRGLRNAQTLNKFCLSVQRKVGTSQLPNSYL